MQPTNLLSEYVKETTTSTMILNVWRNEDSEKKSKSQMGFEPTTLCETYIHFIEAPFTRLFSHI